MVTRHKHLLLYYVADGDDRIGAGLPGAVPTSRGKAARRSCASGSRRATSRRGLNLYQKYGLLVVIVPALLPPPAPFKIFVLLAGVARGAGLAVRRGRVLPRASSDTSVKGCSRSITATRRAPSSRPMRRRPAWSSRACAAGGVAWILWQRRKARLMAKNGETAYNQAFTSIYGSRDFRRRPDAERVARTSSGSTAR